MGLITFIQFISYIKGTIFNQQLLTLGANACSARSVICLVSNYLCLRARLCQKYQLSLIDPRDKIVLQTELDDLCDKLQWSSVAARR